MCAGYGVEGVVDDRQYVAEAPQHLFVVWVRVDGLQGLGFWV